MINYSYKKRNSIRYIRLNSKYFKARKGKMYYLGRPERIKLGKFLITSEETPFMLLPLLKHAKDTNSTLFFLERGAYPQRVAFDVLTNNLKINTPFYSYQISKGINPFMPINEELAYLVISFIKEYYPNITNQKISLLNIKNLNKLWSNINNKDKEKIIKKYSKISEGFEKFVGINKLKFLHILISSEPSTFLDEVNYSIAKNRADRKGSLNYRVRHSKFPILIKETDFGTKKSKYTKEIFNYLKRQFPYGVDKNNDRKLFHELNNFNRQYLKNNFNKISFITLPLMKFIIGSMNIKLNNIVYCDDGIGSGLTYFKAKLFHTLMADDNFRFNIYMHMNDVTTFNETQITKDSDFYEDAPEMFNFYYSKWKRINYKNFNINEKDKEKYGFFVNQLIEFINNYPKLKETLNKADSKVYLIATKLTKRLDRYIAMLFFLIHPIFFNEECLRMFGHHPLINYLQYVLDRQEEFGLGNVLDKIKPKYKEIVKIHKMICMNTLLEAHKKYLDKIKKFDEFFNIYKKNIMKYLNSQKIKSRVLSDSDDFLDLTKIFYRYIDSLNIKPKDIPEGY